METKRLQDPPFYGWEAAKALHALHPALPADYTPVQLFEDLLTLWSAQSCAPRMRAEWSRSNPTLGQCSITAFLAQDLFGGKVYGVPLPDGNFHCYNVVGDCVFDLTCAQFGERQKLLSYALRYEQKREVQFQKEEKRRRYEALRAAFWARHGL